MNPHEAILDELLQKVMVTLSRSDSGRDVAALVIRAADLSRELDEIRGGSKNTDAVSARLDEIGQLRSKKTKGA